MRSEQFSTGYSEFELGKTNGDETQLFLSVTPGLANGPSIRRDGITSPVMYKPKDVLLGSQTCGETYDDIEQRGCTWTIYHHLENFDTKLGKDWLITGAQGFGDLSMNPWILAFFRKGFKFCDGKNDCRFIRLNTNLKSEYIEPCFDRDKIYTALVKYNDDKYAFEDINFTQNPRDANRPNVYANGKRIEGHIEYLMAGKPLLRRNQIVPLYSVIERYSDIRHIFATPRYDYKEPYFIFKLEDIPNEITKFTDFLKEKIGFRNEIDWMYTAEIKITEKEITIQDKTHFASIGLEDGKKSIYFKDEESQDETELQISKEKVSHTLFHANIIVQGRQTTFIYFGEKDLFVEETNSNSTNRRRQALFAPLRIELNDFTFPQLPPNGNKKWINFEKSLIKQWENDGNIEVNRPPQEPGQFRIFKDTTGRITNIEVFFRRNVYPFSAIGLKRKKDPNDPTTLVMLASAGKQFKIGDTVENMAQKMLRYGDCSDAMIMDEGYDVFQLANKPDKTKTNGMKFENQEILDIVAAKIGDLIELKPKIRVVPGNKDLVEEIDNKTKEINLISKRMQYTSLFTVEPQRAQLRALLIVAKKKA